MIACTLFLPIFTAAKDEKYFRKEDNSEKVKRQLSTKQYVCMLFFSFLSNDYAFSLQKRTTSLFTMCCLLNRMSEGPFI